MALTPGLNKMAKAQILDQVALAHCLLLVFPFPPANCQSSSEFISILYHPGDIDNGPIMGRSPTTPPPIKNTISANGKEQILQWASSTFMEHLYSL
jgi:hypothetical protein